VLYYYSRAAALFIPTGINSVKFRTTMRVSGYLCRRCTTSLFGFAGMAIAAPQLARKNRLTYSRIPSTDRHKMGLFNWSFAHFVVDVAEDYVKPPNPTWPMP
jgi:hypothetical protein